MLIRTLCLQSFKLVNLKPSGFNNIIKNSIKQVKKNERNNSSVCLAPLIGYALIIILAKS